ncbi:hypothetical protein FIV42_10695 [Persicimonas caeni]|uniref:TonB-dependent receptor n=1 Tax=Persicimonas caeni TaxID=2292766 RepID=A0A4Y6PSU5_PERCE|nr:TonB-dependent receptor [Persicimonas caeni]QDG51189.1 hypothetical protein FIV42_10695 [Persicimonas caeni]QED32410.1 outer membrane beta-barrel protein [Persicimonas caeni]
MKHFAACLAAVVFVVAASPSLGFAEPTGQIHVVVFGPPNGLPVEGAEVEVGDQTLETNKDGAAWLNVAPGTYTLSISHESMASARIDDVEVARGEGAEVVVEVRADGEVIADVETVELGKGRQAAEAQQPENTGPPGTLSGTVVSFEGQTPIEGARVFVRGLAEEAKTDKNGRFTMQVPSGTWDLSVIHPEYSTASETGVEVAAEGEADVTIAMTPASVRLAAFKVTIPRIEGGTISLLEERKETSQVADVIGAEQFSKSGDSDAASALSRVTGLTVVGGKYVYVRGLGERYSSSLLNGSSLPSPDPERRVVPLDLFPTSILDSVVVQKTYSADMPGGFGGGVVRMRTRSFPSDFSAGVELSLGANTMTTFQDGLAYQGGGLDWLGFDDGTRALPEKVRRAAAQSPLKRGGTFSDNGFSPRELEAIGEAMPNHYSTRSETVMPGLGISADLGDTVELFDADAGYRIALSYDNDHDVNRYNKTYFLNADQTIVNQYDFDERIDEVVLSAMLAGGLQFDEGNMIELTSMISRLTDNETQVYQGYYDDIGDDIRMTRLRWLERQLMFHQLRGEHKVEDWNDIEIDWRYAYGQARRDEPDRRDYRYDWNPRVNDWVLSNRPDGNVRLYSDLVDNSHDLGASVTIPFDVWSSLEAKVKTGADFLYKDRAVSTRRFSFKAEPPPSEQERTQSPEELINDGTIGPDGYEILETTRPTDNYTAAHIIVAPYLLTELPLTETFEIAAGVRLEQSTQTVTTQQLFTNEVDESTLDRLDVLPSLSTTWKFVDDMQLRGAVARTVNRPDFRELSPACFASVVGGRQVCGNPNLERATITHFDARWEWYPSRGESVSVGAFLKLFEAPIEIVLEPGTPPQETYSNAEGATNYGVEFDARKNLDVLSDAFRDFYIAGNVALIASQVDIGENDVLTNTERALQGQSPFVVNMQFGYDNADLGTSATLLYNVFGQRIISVGARGRPDTYEEPSHVVDFVYSQRLSDHFKLGFKAKNLLDLDQPETVGTRQALRQFEGRSFSAKIAWEY